MKLFKRSPLMFVDTTWPPDSKHTRDMPLSRTVYRAGSAVQNCWRKDDCMECERVKVARVQGYMRARVRIAKVQPENTSKFTSDDLKSARQGV